MILFFGTPADKIFAVHVATEISSEDQAKLVWLFGNRKPLTQSTITSSFIGPRAAMVTPWSTNAVEITQNMGIVGIKRIEEFYPAVANTSFDPMISHKYETLDQAIYCLLYTSPSPRDRTRSRMPSSA